jgi:hypothetical protein
MNDIKIRNGGMSWEVNNKENEDIINNIRLMETTERDNLTILTTIPLGRGLEDLINNESAATYLGKATEQDFIDLMKQLENNNNE